MNNPEFYEKYKDLSQLEIDTKFIQSCQFGLLDDTRYLLNSNDLPIKANLYRFDGMGLQYACYYGHLNVAQYLLTSPELKETVDIYTYKKPFELVEEFIKTGNIDAVKFFISFENKYVFKPSKIAEFTIKNINENNLDLARYLIFDLNIKRSKPIDKLLLENPNEEIEKMFQLREVNKSLNKELRDNKATNLRMKL